MHVLYISLTMYLTSITTGVSTYISYPNHIDDVKAGLSPLTTSCVQYDNMADRMRVTV